MKLWNFLFGTNNQTSSSPSVNPSTGLPMIEHTTMDVGGNTFGIDSSWNSVSDWSSFNSDDWGLGNSGWD